VRAVVQRVSRAEVVVDGRTVAQLDATGLLVLLGVTHDDGPAEAARLASKIWHLRVLADERSAADIGAPVLVVSQFTLYADTDKGRRPSWSRAARAEVAEPIYNGFCAELRALGARVQSGVFGAHMEVGSVNDGPVTMVLEV
jgi:D-aminoacyl-tRNA deacylase